MQTETRESIETYRQTTNVNLLILQSVGPNNQPLLTMNWTISGIPTNMMIKSAVAKFMMKMLVTDCRIFLSNNMTIITRLLPISPTVPMTMNNNDNKTMTSVDAGSGGRGGKPEAFMSMAISFTLEFSPAVVCVTTRSSDAAVVPRR